MCILCGRCGEWAPASGDECRARTAERRTDRRPNFGTTTEGTSVPKSRSMARFSEFEFGGSTRLTSINSRRSLHRNKPATIVIIRRTRSRLRLRNSFARIDSHTRSLQLSRSIAFNMAHSSCALSRTRPSCRMFSRYHPLRANRQLSMVRLASASDRNQYWFRHSSRSRPLKLSMKAVSTGSPA